MLRFLVSAILLAVVFLPGPAPGAELREVEPVDREGTPATILEAIDEARAVVDAAADRSSTEQAAAFGRLGDVLMVHGFAGQARQAYLNAKTLAPNRPDWHYMLGLVEMDAGRLDEAVEYLSTAIERNPFESAALIRRGRVHLDQGRLDDAAADFDRALQLSPEAPAALAGLGRVALDQGDYEAAAEYLERALSISPQATRLHQPLAMAYRGMGEVDRARAHLGQVGEGTEPIRDELLDRMQRQSRSPQFYLELALTRAEAGDLSGARQLLGTALQLDPDDALVMENYGEVVARQGDLDEARAAFQRLVELRPDSAQPLILLGQVEELQGRLAEAGEAYRAALERESGHLPAEEGLAFLKLAEGDFSGARADFSRLAERPDQQGQARFAYWAALAMLGDGECERGRVALNNLRERFPADGDVLVALARVRATCGDAETAELEEALEWVETVYQMAPDIENAASLAMVHAALGQFDDAVDLQAHAMFEALKAGQLEARADLRADMERYQDGRAARVPFAPGYPAFPSP